MVVSGYLSDTTLGFRHRLRDHPLNPEAGAQHDKPMLARIGFNKILTCRRIANNHKQQHQHKQGGRQPPFRRPLQDRLMRMRRGRGDNIGKMHRANPRHRMLDCQINRPGP